MLKKKKKRPLQKEIVFSPADICEHPEVVPLRVSFS